MHFNLHLPKTWHAAVTGIWSEIPEILCVEINEELLRTTCHMNNFCWREFVVMFFSPINLSNLLKLHLPGIKARGGVWGKKKFGLYQSPTCLKSYYFLRNRKIFVYDENMARQSLGLFLIPIQNIKG